jgi:hypothetical protein
MAHRSSSYREFWPYYLNEHAKAETRLIHFLGTGGSLLALIVALATQSWWVLIAVPVAGYAPAWFAHFFVEHNRPATFIHPLWSLISDFRMFFLWCAGELEPELQRAGVIQPPPGRQHRA